MILWHKMTSCCLAFWSMKPPREWGLVCFNQQMSACSPHCKNLFINRYFMTSKHLYKTVEMDLNITSFSFHMVTCGQIRPRVWDFVYMNTYKISGLFSMTFNHGHIWMKDTLITSDKEKTFAATNCHVIHFTIENKLSAEVIFPGTISWSIVQGACNFAPTVTYQTALATV